MINLKVRHKLVGTTPVASLLSTLLTACSWARKEDHQSFEI